MKIRIVNLLKIVWVPLAVTWLGALLNTLVVRANGGMPALNLDEAYSRWVPISSQTHYSFLGDVIPVLSYECSLGDILMYLGTVIWLFISVKYIYLAVKETKARKLSWY
jgi:hypothetical protein